jgi:hypothetical protein
MSPTMSASAESSGRMLKKPASGILASLQEAVKRKT